MKTYNILQENKTGFEKELFVTINYFNTVKLLCDRFLFATPTYNIICSKRHSRFSMHIYILPICFSGFGQSHQSDPRAKEADDDEVYSVGEPERRGQNGARKMGAGVGLVHN